MTLPASGPLAFSAIRTEAVETGVFTIGKASIRALAGKSSGTIKASDFYGKSHGPLLPLDSLIKLTGMNVSSSSTDDSDNVYYVGSISTDAAICKTDAQGNVLWAKRSVGGSYKDVCFHEGLVYAVGLDSTARGIKDFVIVKFSTEGAVVGAKTIHAGSTTISGGAYCICSLGTGNGIVVGGAISVVSSGSPVILFMNSSMTVTKHITLPNSESAKKLKLINSSLYALTLFTGNGAYSTYASKIRKFQIDGTQVQVFSYSAPPGGTTGIGMAIYDFAVDASDKVYAVGVYDLDNTGSSYSTLGFYVSHSATGTGVYTRGYGYIGYGTSLPFLNVVAVDPATGHILVSYNNYYLYKLDTTHAVIWSNTWGGGGSAPSLTIEGSSFVLRQSTNPTFSEFRAPLTGLKLGTYSTHLYAANSKFMPTTGGSGFVFSSLLIATISGSVIATLQYADPVIATTDLAVSRVSYNPL